MEREDIRYQDRIIRDTRIMVGKPVVKGTRIMVGKPVVKGTRIPVELVLEYLARNPNFDDLFADYPRLTMDDVKACFSYARAALERRRRRDGNIPPAASHRASV